MPQPPPEINDTEINDPETNHTETVTPKPVTPKPVVGTALSYRGRLFHMYDHQGCDSCCSACRPPYLPPLRGVHVTYVPAVKAYLCGYCVRTRWPDSQSIPER